MPRHATGKGNAASEVTEQSDDSTKTPKRRKGKDGISVAMPARKPSNSPAKAPVVQLRKENYYPLVGDFLEWLAGRNMTPKTILNRRQSLDDFARYARAQGIALNVGEITREHVQAYVVDHFQNRRLKASTVKIRLTSLKLFFRWCVDEGELKTSPAARVMNPIAPEEPPEMFSEAEIRKMLATCERGRDFRSVRDYALMRLLLSVGMRRGELANMRMDDFNWDEREVSLFGKARRHRSVAFGRKASDALRRYRRERERYKDGAYADDPHFWIGQQGPLTYEGLYRIVRRRATEAGLDLTKVHAFRHTSVHLWLKSGGSEGAATKRFGWKGRDMLDRYGSKLAEDRSKEEYRRLTPDDEI